jgi:dolichol-phosphate mannosyltransferase
MSEREQVLCVVCPCYNEAEGIGRFHEELKTVLVSFPDLDHRIIYVDDGSTDSTLAQLNALAQGDPRVRVYALSRNFGHQIALTAGLDAARGDAVLMMDSDLQHPPTLIPRLVELWRQGYEVVSAVRQTTGGVSVFKRLSSRAFYWILNRLSEVPLIPGAADFCLLSRPAYTALRRLPERHRFLRGLVSWIGFQRTVVPFEAPPRAAGRSKYTWRSMFRLALDAVFSFSTTPLRLATRLGLIVLAAGLLSGFYFLSQYLGEPGAVPGWSGIVSIVLLLGGIQLTCTGLVGQYLARVMEEVKGRPLYVLKQQPRRRRQGLGRRRLSARE